MTNDSIAKSPTVISSNSTESQILQDTSEQGRKDRHERYNKLRQLIEDDPSLGYGDQVGKSPYKFYSSEPKDAIVLVGRKDTSKPLRVDEKTGNVENGIIRRAPYHKLDTENAMSEMREDLNNVKGYATDSIHESADTVKKSLMDSGYPSDMVDVMINKSFSELVSYNKSKKSEH